MINKWNNREAKLFVKESLSKGINKDLALRIYSTRLLGNESKIVLHGGGNTSVKIFLNKNNKEYQYLYVKGSGKDMSDIDADGFPCLELDNLQKLKKYKKITDFEMINFQKKFMVDTSFPNPSVETLLHAFLPQKFIDHSHSNSILSLINQKNSRLICKKIFGNNLAIVPYIMPGFDLAKKAYEIYNKNTDVKGLILLNHGIFTFGHTAKESYDRMIKFISIAENELKNIYFKINYNKSNVDVSLISNYLRNLSSIKKNDDFERKIVNYSNNLFINKFFENKNYSKVKGPSTPDHVIRIKHKPLFLDISNIDQKNIYSFLQKKFQIYRKSYIKYFNQNKKINKYASMHDPNPRLIVIKNIGIFSTGKNLKEAKISMDIGINSLKTILDSILYGNFKSINQKEIFKMEYWPLELAKLKKSNKPLEGNVTVITGGLGTLGYATANKFLNEGSEVIILDNLNEKKLIKFDLNNISYFKCDVTKNKEIKNILKKISLIYGGLDIVISNAGYAIQKPLKNINKLTLEKSFSINLFAHHFLAQQSVEILKRQSTGGSILFNITKQAINPGADFASYGLPKATLFFLMKQYSLEYSKFGIRFNGVNPDRIKSGILTKDMILKRAKSRGISVNKYLKGNLLKTEVKPEDVAKAFFYLSMSYKTTACVITVDGGNIEASLR